MNKFKSPSDTRVLEDCYCKDCGAMVIEQLNNTQLARFEHDPWILYCANIECGHHIGEGYFQTDLDWIES